MTLSIAVGVWVLSGCATGGTQSAEYRHYVNPVHHWSVCYPPDWALNSGEVDFVKIRSPLTLRGRRGLVGIHSGTFGPEWLEVDSLDYFADKISDRLGAPDYAGGTAVGDVVPANNGTERRHARS
jgi:hypothetical protein